MDIKHNTTIELDAYFDGKSLKNYNGDIGDWRGSDVVEQINITRDIEEIGLPKGSYKVKISFEYIND